MKKKSKSYDTLKGWGLNHQNESKQIKRQFGRPNHVNFESFIWHYKLIFMSSKIVYSYVNRRYNSLGIISFQNDKTSNVPIVIGHFYAFQKNWWKVHWILVLYQQIISPFYSICKKLRNKWTNFLHSIAKIEI
jgi:hypothetical protein